MKQLWENLHVVARRFLRSDDDGCIYEITSMDLSIWALDGIYLLEGYQGIHAFFPYIVANLYAFVELEVDGKNAQTSI